VFHDSAVGNHAALRIERTASVPAFGKFAAVAVICQPYLLHALGLEDAACLASRMIL